jgi:ACR3 family arsenite efflux pump ArsB
MRLVVSIIGGSVVSIVAFSALWSGFVVQHHSYGGDSRLSQFEGTLTFFGVYLFPILLAALLLVVISSEFALIKKKKVRAVTWWRRLTWGVVTIAVLAGITGTANPDLVLSALICGFAAATAGALVFEHMVAGIPKKEEANQAPEPTAPSGRGSS